MENEHIFVVDLPIGGVSRRISVGAQPVAVLAAAGARAALGAARAVGWAGDRRGG